MKYYVYRHVRLDTNTPFYVGKGYGRRATSKSGRNKYWHNIVKRYGYEVEIMLAGLTEDEALSKEIEFIGLYKGLKYCEANIALGGTSNSGFKASKELKKLLSERAKNDTRLVPTQFKKGVSTWNKDRKHSAEHRKNLSKSHVGLPGNRRRLVKDRVTGVTYSSVEEAATVLEIKRTTLNAMLSGQSRNKTNLVYVNKP